MSDIVYRKCKSVEGLEVTADAQFRYKGKPKKAIYCHTITGRKATVRVTIMWGGKNHYWQAANLGRKAYGLEISKRFYVDAREAIKQNINVDMFAQAESKYYTRPNVLKQAVQQELALV